MRDHSTLPPLTGGIRHRRAAWTAALLLAACARQPSSDGRASARSEGALTPDRLALPASSSQVAERLAQSPRHGEYLMIPAGEGDSVRAWITYPERRGAAPVVVVIHEIFGLSTWIRGVADQLAADGYVAIAPDLLTGRADPAPGSDTLTQSVAMAAIQKLPPADVQRRIAATARYAMRLPAARQVYSVIGFCWGGSTSFATAVVSPPGQKSAIVYYGTSPPLSALVSVQIPVLGLYGENDARVVSTVAPADSALKSLRKSFAAHIFAGAGHGFLRQQEGAAGANLAAARAAWPLTLEFLRTTLGRGE